MTGTSKALIRGSLAMLGTVVGAGTFGLPYAMKTMGVFAGSVTYWVIALAILATHLLYAEVILKDAAMRQRRLPGHVRSILGEWPGYLAFISHPLNTVGACLAYLILGGEFLAVLARAVGLPHVVLGWQIIFWAGGAVTVFLGLKILSRVEAWMTWGLIVLLLLSVGFFFSRSDSGLFFGAQWGAIFAPLGILVFALSAFNVIPEVIEICGRDRKRVRRAVAMGSIGAAVLMWLFGVFGYVAIGPGLTTDPSDLAQAFPAAFFWLLPAVGFFAVATSFVTIMQDLKAMLQLDLRIPKVIAWATALGAPLLFLLATDRNFIETVGFVGSIFGAINGILIASMAYTVTKYRSAALLCAAVFCIAFFWRILSLR